MPISNRPLPIGWGEDDLPAVHVALMTDMLNRVRAMSCMEIGAGAGYQAAVLAELVKRVLHGRAHRAAAEAARRRRQRLGYANVQVRAANGYYGWPEHAHLRQNHRHRRIRAGAHAAHRAVEARRTHGRAHRNCREASLTLVTKDAAGVISLRDLLPVRSPSSTNLEMSAAP